MSRPTVVLSLGVAIAIFAVGIIGFQLAGGLDGGARTGIDSAALAALDERLRDLEHALQKRLRRLEARTVAASEERIVKESGVAGGDDGEASESGDADAPAVPERLAERLDALERRIRGLEEDPVERGYNYLSSASAELRRQGVLTLERIAANDPDARAAIRDMLQDPSAGVRQTSIDTLADLGDRESAGAITGLLADSDASVRREAIGALKRLGATESAAAIAALIGDDDVRVRQYAADAIGEMKFGAGSGALIAALGDENEAVRGEAIDSLGEIGARHAAGRLREMYDGNPGSNRMRLALSLNALGDPKPLDGEFASLSRSALEAPGESERVRSLRSLSRYFRERSRDVFTRALEDPSPQVRRTAQDSLESRRPEWRRR